LTTPAVPPQVVPLLQAASQRLSAGRPAEARALLEQVLRAAPRSSDALHLYAVSLRLLGDAAGAEAPARQAIAVDKKQASFHATLGDILALLGRKDEAEKSYRAALALNRLYIPAGRQLALLLTELGRPEDALKVITPLAGPSVTDHGVLHAYAGALKAVGRVDDALAIYERWVIAAPTSGVAEHNLAATLGDLGRSAEAEVAARRAFAKGLDAPETRLVQARALVTLGCYDEAEAAFHAALTRQPLYVEAHRDLAQLIWMRTENKDQATAAIDAGLRRDPNATALRQLKAKVLTFAGDLAGADAVLRDAAQRRPDDAAVQMSAAQAAIEVGDPARGLLNAERGRALSTPDDPQAATFVCEAMLAVGRTKEAAALAEDMLRRSPHAQQPLAYVATAWRILGDPRYGELYDYAAFVRPWTIDVPDGWTSLDAYLADLAQALNAQHRLKTHPLDQSLREGSQVSHVLQSDHPAIKAFPEAVDGPIRAHMQAVGKGRDALRSRNTGDYRFQGVWSVKLRPGGGRHVDHLHPEGWLSSACYIDLPGAIEGEGRQGWIKFGQPGVPTVPKLEPEHFVKPEPGLLVLFPSYMWHGTVPFEGPDSRLTVAFDVVPQRR
jgi:tetratricopeptide (TPR) repeat protein